VGELAMVKRTSLITIDSRVLSPEGVVFSTDPKRAEAEDEVSYFIKGPDIETVFAEISGCMLAKAVGLPVPDVAACEFVGDTYAGSKKVDDAARDVEPWLNRPQRVKNFDDLFSALVVDIWLANKDRNIGNVLGKPMHGGKIEFVFIDFEKSRALRPSPTVSSTMLQPRELWPSGILGHELSEKKPLYPPVPMIERIQSLPTERCAEIIHEGALAMGALGG
jgi:hypothetical protein